MPITSLPDVQNESDVKGNRTIIVFRVADNLFGIDVEHIREIIEPTRITRVPLVNRTILGAINVRGLIVPIIDLCKRLYDCERTDSKTSRIFICEAKDGAESVMIGGMVDAVVSVADLSDGDMSESPDFGSKLRPDFIRCAAKIDGQYIMLLDVDRVFDIEELGKLAVQDVNAAENLAIKSEEYEEEGLKDVLGHADIKVSEDRGSYIQFSIGDELYGVDVKRVQEVVKIGSLERIPNALPFLKGVMNIRGTATPLVDMRLRCSLPEKEYTEDTPVMVINVKDIPVGLVVDDVTNILEIPSAAVQDTFHYSAQIDRDFISGLAEISDKFVILVNVDRILSDEEFTDLKNHEADLGAS
ncbi:MAG: chemotaxis protein CheW [Spirochaetes bacterium]|nr:chemotaxis protein CheW [Spirochaetota bacterium]